MKRFLTEPLLHFLLLGAMIFAGYALTFGDDDVEQDEIVISRAKIEALTDKFTRTWHRRPSQQEVDGLIQDLVREEVAVREAAALGIDRDDSVIRRLLRQRLEFVTEDVVALSEPSEADLNHYLSAHADDFLTEPRISFSQVFFDPQRRGPSLAADTEQLRARLNTRGGRIDVATLGDASLLERQFTALPIGAVAQQFGEAFAESLVMQTPGQWSGPITSAYGQHLVYVGDFTPGRVPPLAEVRDAVRRAWADAQRAAALDAFYTGLLQRYRVTVEMPQPKAGEDTLAELR